MVTYSKIGRYGRLGNQLFQFAATIGIARKLGYDVKFPVENITCPVPEHFRDGTTLQVSFDVPKVFNIGTSLLAPRAEIKSEYALEEPTFHFSKDLFEINDGCDLTGFFQTEKYFKHIEGEIRELLSFKLDIKEKAKALYPTVNASTVAIHVRRGDYLYQPYHHPVCSEEYYYKATQLFAEDSPYFLIFSDDISYCKELFGEQENVRYIDSNDPYVELCLMSMCDHNIIANSSFSWWGAWLNQNVNKKVVAPHQWFGPAYAHTHSNLSDLFCKDWIII